MFFLVSSGMHVLLTSGEDILYLASNSEDEINLDCVFALAPYVRAPSLQKKRLEQEHFYSLVCIQGEH